MFLLVNSIRGTLPGASGRGGLDWPDFRDSPLLREAPPCGRGSFTFAHWDIDADAMLTEHSHPHEQVASMIAGEFELTVNGEAKVLRPGSVAIVPSDAVHSGRAITICRIIDVFYPVREDYR